MVTWNVIEYIDEHGNSPFANWFARLNSQAAARIATVLYRIEQGNLSNTKSVGKGVMEYRLDFGPGYRIYFGKDKDFLIILLLGGTKQRQDKDINKAQTYWKVYKQKKRNK